MTKKVINKNDIQSKKL